MTTPAKPANGIDPQWIVAIVGAVRNVLKTAAGLRVAARSPSIKDGCNPTHDVSAVIGFSGQVIGSVVISLPRALAAHVVGKFAGMEIDPGSPDFADAFGEIGNMIAGSTQKDLGGVARVALGNVVVGADRWIGRLSDAPCIVVPCSTPAGNLAIEVSIKRAG